MELDFTKELEPTNLAANLTAEERASISTKLNVFNPTQPENRVTEIQHWDINEFNKPHLPVIIGALKHPETFSDWADHPDLGISTDAKNQRIRTLDLAIHMPGQGWHIPTFLKQFEEAILLAVKAEKAVNPNAAQRFVHITIDQKLVQPDKPGRRPGLHTDVGLRDDNGKQLDVIAENYAYIAKQKGISDHAYVMHDVLPTGFYPGPFPMTGETDKIKSFEEQAVGQTMSSYPNYSLLRLNAYDIHTATLNDTGKEVRRTFFKIQFTERLLDRDVNTQNPHFDYEKARNAESLNQQIILEEGKLLEILNANGYEYFVNLTFDSEKLSNEARREACLNCRLALSYTFAAKIRLAESALGHSLPADEMVTESSRLAKLETNQEKVIQLGLILKAMRENPNRGSDEWKAAINEAATKAIGCDAVKWTEGIKNIASDKTQFLKRG